MNKCCSVCRVAKDASAFYKAANVLKNNTFDPRLYPEQGVLAFPSGDGLPSAQNAVHIELEQSDE